METYDAIMSRRTAHLWKDEPVPEAVVEKALRGAHMAPCHRFTWPWRFVRVSEAHRGPLYELALAVKSKGRKMPETFSDKVRRKVLNPAHLLVVVQGKKDNAFEAKEDYAAIACAIQNIALIVHAEGFASKWSTGGLTTHPETFRLFGVDPLTEDIVGFVWIGVPENTAPAAPERTPLEDHVRWTS